MILGSYTLTCAVWSLIQTHVVEVQIIFSGKFEKLTFQTHFLVNSNSRLDEGSCQTGDVLKVLSRPESNKLTLKDLSFISLDLKSTDGKYRTAPLQQVQFWLNYYFT